jgi:hypothetical protein
VEQDVFLGPLFTLGALLVVVGVRRRLGFLVAAGVAAIAADQKLPAAQRLNRRLAKPASDV